jgi:hypothetical protein
MRMALERSNVQRATCNAQRPNVLTHLLLNRIVRVVLVPHRHQLVAGLADVFAVFDLAVELARDVELLFDLRVGAVTDLDLAIELDDGGVDAQPLQLDRPILRLTLDV